MKTLLFILLILSPLLISCGAGREHKSQEDNIRESVFRYQFRHNASGQQQSARVYFLSIGRNDVDPSDDFMNRFGNHRPPVRKASASHIVNDGAVVDKDTNEKGVIFRVLDIEWISDAEAEVKGGYYETPRSSSENIYTLKKANGIWTVIKDQLKTIS